MGMDVSNDRNNSLCGQELPRTLMYNNFYRQGETCGDRGLGIYCSQTSSHLELLHIDTSTFEAQKAFAVVLESYEPLERLSSAQEQTSWLEYEQNYIFVQETPSQSSLENDNAAYDPFNSPSESAFRGEQYNGDEAKLEIFRDESPFAAGYAAMAG